MEKQLSPEDELAELSANITQDTDSDSDLPKSTRKPKAAKSSKRTKTPPKPQPQPAPPIFTPEFKKKIQEEAKDKAEETQRLNLLKYIYGHFNSSVLSKYCDGVSKPKPTASLAELKAIWSQINQNQSASAKRELADSIFFAGTKLLEYGLVTNGFDAIGLPLAFQDRKELLDEPLEQISLDLPDMHNPYLKLLMITAKITQEFIAAKNLSKQQDHDGQAN